MRGKLTELWHRHLDRKPWIFRDQFGLAYLFTAKDHVAEYCEQSAVIDNPALLACLQANVKPGQTFVDLSPVIGGVTMLAGRQVQDTGAVFAFAPEVGTYRQLVNNVALNSLTRCVRVIGREVLSQRAGLDEFAATWRWERVDCLRLKGGTQLGELQASAAGLFQAGRIRQVLVDEVEPKGVAQASALLKEAGFTVQMITGGGKIQPLPVSGAAGKINLIATLPEAGHA